MGVTAGMPPRVEAGMKSALLDLVDGAVEAGWTTARACAVLELDGHRCRRWRHRRDAGRLDDHTAGGVAVHAITPAERQAILDLFDAWGDIDGGVRKLAHRGSYENLVWVSPSTLYRVLAGEGLVLPAKPQRTPVPARPLPDWIEWKRHQIWIYDITHFPRAGRVAYAILDVVTRKWLATHVGIEETATQVEVVFTDALDAEGLWERIEARWADGARPDDGDGDPDEPILLVMSDNGPQMRAGTTRGVLGPVLHRGALRPPRHPHRPSMDRNAVRPHQNRMAPPRTDHRPQRAANRTRQRPTRLQHPPPARIPRLRHPRRRTPRPRRHHPPSPPRRPQMGPPQPHRLPSQQQTQPAMKHTPTALCNQTPQNGHLLRNTSRSALRWGWPRNCRSG